MTHAHTNQHTSGCLCGRLCPLPSALSCARGGRQRDGCPLFSLPLLLSSLILLLSHTQTYPALLSSPLHLSLPHYLPLQFALFIASLILSVSICSLLILLISLRLSFRLSASLALISLLREETPAPSVLFLSPSYAHAISRSLSKLNS